MRTGKRASDQISTGNLLAEFLFLVYGGWVYFALWPFLSILIRFRAHYEPKRGALYLSHNPGENETEDEDGAGGEGDEGIQLKVKGYLSLMTRMIRIEGYNGLAQGIFPDSVYGVLEYITHAIEIYGIRPRTVLPQIIEDIMGISIFASLRLPIIVFLYRATTSSKYIPIPQMFSTLLSPSERRNLLKLYLIPGLFASVLSLDIGYYCLIRIRTKLFTFRYESPLEFALLYGSILVITLLLCPLEVIIIRLALQKYRTADYRGPSASALLSASHDEERELGGLQGQEGLRFLGSEELINLRGEVDPYRGLVDCAEKIVREEGWGVFWRGWLIAFGINLLCDPTVAIPWYCLKRLRKFYST